MDLNGKQGVVLGGTSGIGLAAVKLLLDAGATVTAAGRSPDRIGEAQAAAPGANYRSVDVLDRDALETLFAELAPMDFLICAATGGERALGPFLEMDLDSFQGSFRKLWGYTNAVRLGAGHMAEGGAIVLVSGFPARKCGPGAIALSTVGNAVEGFCRGVAPELAQRKLRINVVSPGTIDTPMFAVEGEARDQFFAQATKNILIPRPGTADEVADGILFVLRNDYVTGTTVDVDGGALLP